MPFVYFCINVTNAFFFFFLRKCICKPSMSFLFVNMVVFTQYRPLMQEWRRFFLVAEEASGLIFKDWLDFTVLLTHSGGMFWMKVTVTINFKRM